MTMRTRTSELTRIFGPAKGRELTDEESDALNQQARNAGRRGKGTEALLHLVAATSPDAIAKAVVASKERAASKARAMLDGTADAGGWLVFDSLSPHAHDFVSDEEWRRSACGLQPPCGGCHACMLATFGATYARRATLADLDAMGEIDGDDDGE